MGTGEFTARGIGNPAYHPFPLEERNTPSRSMLQKTGKSSGLMGLLSRMQTNST